jgi:hypothetical protein
VAFGFFLFLAGLIGLGMVVFVRDFLLENWTSGSGSWKRKWGSSVITVAMLLAIPLGFSFALTASRRVVMNDELAGREARVRPADSARSLTKPHTTRGWRIGRRAGVRATLLAAAVAAGGSCT